MEEKYEPYLFGVTHDAGSLAILLDQIKELKIRKVGLEVAKIAFSRQYAGYVDRDSILFFEALVDYFKRKKIEIVYLNPDSHFIEQVKKAVSVAKSGVGRPNFRVNPFSISNDYDKSVHIGLLREMEKTALTKMPELLIVGAGHAGPMRKDFLVPKEKFRIFSSLDPALARRIILGETRLVRRYQAQKRRAKAKLPKKEKRRQRK